MGQEGPQELPALAGKVPKRKRVGGRRRRALCTPKPPGNPRIHSPQPGTLQEGAHIIDAMNAVGVDFATFGNHEFDYGHLDLACSFRSKDIVSRGPGDAEGRGGGHRGQIMGSLRAFFGRIPKGAERESYLPRSEATSRWSTGSRATMTTRRREWLESSAVD